MDTKQYTDERGTDSRLLTGMAFLAENPEAYGLVPDACPAVTSDLLLAVNGHSAAGGAVSPTYPVEEGGVDGLLDTLYGSLIPRTDDNTRLLRATFGESEGMQEHTVARYCAALAEATALRVLDGTAKGSSPEQICSMLGEEIPRGLSRLRETVSGDVAIRYDDAFFSVSLGACRVTPEGEGHYRVDVFAAGDFQVYLLDSEGLHPLWLRSTPLLTPDTPEAGGVAPVWSCLRLHHPEPFALLLLSDSLCTPSAPELRAMTENPGLIWRYRMRLEDQLLRVITSCVREQEFGERASRYFTGRSHGRDSASGAMTVLREGVSYEVFRSLCQTRLSRLEVLISLMPEGYDPARVPRQLSRAVMEENHLRRLLEREKGVSDRVSEAIRLCALDKLKTGPVTDPLPPPSNVPAYRRLPWEEIHAAFRRYDVDNDTDRARAEEIRHILRENLTDHWVYLRPCLLKAASRTQVPAAGRSYEACVGMNARLLRMQNRRKKQLRGLDTLLSDSLTVLRAEGRDWLEGRAGDGSVSAWTHGLTHDLPDALAPLLESWQNETETYRSLMSAYTYERELLFRMDTHPDHGFFAEDWQRIQNGALPDARWDTLRETLAETDSYRELWESLRRVSKGMGALVARIESRGAERRMARELADRPDIQLAALRASVYEDMDWGESVVTVLDPALRREHKEAVRRWQETCELADRRAEAYASYTAAWHAYLPEESAGKQS